MDFNLFIKMEKNSRHCVFSVFDFNAFNRLEIMVVDVGVPADWVKVNVQRMVCIFVFFSSSPWFAATAL